MGSWGTSSVYVFFGLCVRMGQIRNQPKEKIRQYVIPIDYFAIYTTFHTILMVGYNRSYRWWSGGYWLPCSPWDRHAAADGVLVWGGNCEGDLEEEND